MAALLFAHVVRAQEDPNLSYTIVLVDENGACQHGDEKLCAAAADFAKKLQNSAIIKAFGCTKPAITEDTPNAARLP
jgi:hypothetical protein